MEKRRYFGAQGRFSGDLFKKTEYEEDTMKRVNNTIRALAMVLLVCMLLTNVVFAAETGSAGETCLNDAGLVKYVAVQDQGSAVMEVAAGTSDACVIDITMANAMTGEGTSYADLTYSVALTEEEYGVSFRKGSDLTAKFNEFMAQLKADGTLQALAEKYELTLAD